MKKKLIVLSLVLITFLYLLYEFKIHTETGEYIANYKDSLASKTGKYVVIYNPPIIIDTETMEVAPLIRDVFETGIVYRIFVSDNTIYCLMYGQDVKVLAINTNDFSYKTIYSQNENFDVFGVELSDFSYEQFQKDNISLFYVNDKRIYIYNEELKTITEENLITKQSHFVMSGVNKPIFENSVFYYIDDNYSVYSYDISKQEKREIITDVPVDNIYKTKDKLWFSIVATNQIGYYFDKRIYMTDIFSSEFAVDGNCIYYTDNNNLFYYDKDGEKKQLTDFFVSYISILSDTDLIYCYGFDSTARHILLNKRTGKIVFEYRESTN